MDKNLTATFGNGCFWCLEAAMLRVRGVIKSTSGYAGGHTLNPNYEQVSSGETGHAEVVQVEYDPSQITYADLLRVFWTTHNPTTPNRSGNDVGTQYRSVILYTNDEQKKQAEESKVAAQTNWDDPIVTQIVPLDKFWPAEDYHQNYFAKNPDNAYCQLVINPKIAHLKAELKDLLKAEA